MRQQCSKERDNRVTNAQLYLRVPSRPPREKKSSLEGSKNSSRQHDPCKHDHTCMLHRSSLGGKSVGFFGRQLKRLYRFPMPLLWPRLGILDLNWSPFTSSWCHHPIEDADIVAPGL